MNVTRKKIAIIEQIVHQYKRLGVLTKKLSADELAYVARNSLTKTLTEDLKSLKKNKG